MTENEKKNKELAEWLGICWHEPIDMRNVMVGAPIPICSKCNHNVIDAHRFNTDFTSDSGKVQLLRLMPEDFFGVDQYGRIVLTVDYITDKTGKLRDACLEWMRREKG